MLILLAAEEQRRLEEPTPDDLVLSIGTFCVTESGIRAKLRPPLSRLPGYYPWAFFPAGVATLKLLVADDQLLEQSVTSNIISRLGFSEEEKDQLAKMIGNISWTYDDNHVPILEHDSELCDDVDRLIRWGVGLADRCPNKSVANELISLPKMRPPELLARYIQPYLS